MRKPTESLINLFFNPRNKALQGALPKKITNQIDHLLSEEAFIACEIRIKQEELSYLLEKQERILDKITHYSDETETFIPNKKMESMEILLSECIRASILQNQDNIKHGPIQGGYDRDILMLFEPIFAALKISYGLAEDLEPREISESLHFSFAKLAMPDISITIKDYANAGYKLWLKDILNEVHMTIKEAHQKVNEDCALLEKQLYDCIADGTDATPIHWKPCAAALKIFEQTAKEHDFKIAKSGHTMMLERMENAHRTVQIPYF